MAALFRPASRHARLQGGYAWRVLLLMVLGGLLFLLRDFGFVPGQAGQSTQNDFCKQDLGESLQRQGHGPFGHRLGADGEFLSMHGLCSLSRPRGRGPSPRR